MVGVRIILAWVALLSAIVFQLPLIFTLAYPSPPTAEPDSSPMYCSIAGVVWLVIAVKLWRVPPLPPLEEEEGSRSE